MPALHGIDSFSGKMNMAHAMLNAGWNPGTFEHTRDPIYETCLSVQGQTSYLMMLLRSVPGSLNVMGPPCKFWLPFLTASVHKRSHDNPYGDISSEWVVQGNSIGGFVAKVVRMSGALGLCYLIEQPLNSWLHKFPPVVKAYAMTHGSRAYVRMGNFGHNAAKPSELYGNVPWLLQLQALSATSKRRKKFVKLAIRKGKNTFGNKAMLGKSAAYTPQFSAAVVKLHGSEHVLTTA